MKKILLVCSEGMSTSFLTAKMQQLADQKGLELKIYARPENAIEEELEQGGLNAVLLGPQVAYMRSKIEERIAGQAPLDAINPLDFGRCNAENVLNQALKLIEQ